MKQNINIEAEGNELVLKNKAGDYVIIPKKYRLEVQDMIKEGCHGCIDALVETLPVMEDYAQDGSLYPEEPSINPNNPIKLPEVTITAEAPTWLKYRREYEKDNPYKPYQEKNEYLRRFKPERVQAKEKIYKDEWERKRDNYVDVMMAAEKRINDLWDYEQRKSNGDLKWWEKKVKVVNTTSQQDEAMIRQQAQMQLDWKNKPLEEKIGIIGMEAALTFLPEIAMAKYAANVGQVGKMLNIIDDGKSINKVIGATKAGSKIVSKGDDVVNTIVNQLDEPPLEIVFDDMLPNRNSINLGRGANYTKTKKQIPYDKIDLGNDLVLYNNASRQVSDESILGTHRAIKSIKNSKTNEYIDLKSWKDGDNLYYYFSANMPSSKIKAGKAYMELEKHIPKGATILENSSISMDSFNNILKQLKSPKFESYVKGKITLNNMSIHNKVPISDKQSIYATSNRVLFDNIEDAKSSVLELNKLLKEHNLPEASIITNNITTQPAAHLPFEHKITYGIDIPNIALKKLYTILGITSTGTAIQSQQQNKTE